MPLTSINIQFIPEAQMRQPGLGDWWFEGDTLQIRATNDTPDATEGEGPWPFLIALHELVEAILCQAHGVKEADVDAHDNLFESEDHAEEDEPGDDPRAPYRTQHRQAMLIEHLMANFLGLTDYGTMR